MAISDFNVIDSAAILYLIENTNTFSEVTNFIWSSPKLAQTIFRPCLVSVLISVTIDRSVFPSQPIEILGEATKQEVSSDLSSLCVYQNQTWHMDLGSHREDVQAVWWPLTSGVRSRQTGSELVSKLSLHLSKPILVWTPKTFGDLWPLGCKAAKQEVSS